MHENNRQESGKVSFFEKYRHFILNILILIFVFWIGFEQGRQSQVQTADNPVPIDSAVIKSADDGKDVDFSLYWKVWDTLKDKYVDSGNLDAKKMLYGSINGMLYSTGDPYTIFLNPDENKKFNEEIDGNFEGIGAELGVKNGILTIIAPLEGAPAEKAGLRPGDKIIDINGKHASEMTLDEAVSQIRGQKGTEVTLTIFREGSESAFDIKVQRDVINVKSVKFEIKEGGIAYIKISRFGEDTVRDFSSALRSAKSLNPKGIILDLRSNPGGYLDGSIEIASMMLPKGKTILIEEDAKKRQKKMNSRGGDVASDIETVVLINEGSASASEILAGALKENRDNVTLLGKKTFGKGSVQELVKLSQGTSVKITVARWLTPNGNQINEKGIIPEIEVGLSDDDYENDRDPQLERAVEILR